jgi:hypothetical protein
MTKRQLIDEIMDINRSADPAFLARFSDDELTAYLDHLHSTERPRLQGDRERFEKYFADCPLVGARSTFAGPETASDPGIYVPQKTSEEPFAEQELAEVALA